MKPFSQHLDDYLAYATTANQSAVHVRQVKFVELRMLRWLHEQYGITAPEKLTPQHLDAWVRHYSSRTTGRGLPLKATSISKQFQCDRTFLKWLGKIGALHERYFEKVPLVKIPFRLPTGVLSHKQVEKLLSYVDTSTAAGIQFRAILEFLYSSGVRVSELLGLNLQDIDLSNRTAHIVGKGAKERMVTFGATARKYLETYLRSIRPLRLRVQSEQGVWLDAGCERLPYHTLRRQLIELVAKASMSVEVTAHTFRRSFTTEMLRGGANPYHVAELLGHRDMETMKNYAKLTIVDLKKTHAKCHPRERERQ